MAETAVNAERMSTKPIDWTQHDHLLGKHVDREVAKRVGCSIVAVCHRRKKLGIPAADPRRDWTAAEERRLTMAWGDLKPEKIAELLNRGVSGLCRKARELELGSPDRGAMTLQQAAAYSGWDNEALLRAGKALGMKLHRRRPLAPERESRVKARKGRRPASPYAISVEHVERMAAWCAEFGGKKFGVADSVEIGPLGAVSACTQCGRSGIRHAGRGLCAACYRRQRRAAGLTKRPGPQNWTNRTCADCGGSFDVPAGRRHGSPPRFCDSCRMRGIGEPLRRVS